MGKLYNKGWTVAETNRLAYIIRHWFPAYKLDKESLMKFVKRCKDNPNYGGYMPGISKSESDFILSLPT